MNMRFKKFAFTLLEVLIVIGIIFILAGLLLVAVAKAKGSAKDVQCLNNMKQFLQASQIYTQDYNGAFPGKSPSWDEAIAKYLLEGDMTGSWVEGNFVSDNLRFTIRQRFACPFNPVMRRTGDEKSMKGDSSYGINSLIAYGKPPLKVGQIQAPAQTILFGDSSNDKLNTTNAPVPDLTLEGSLLFNPRHNGENYITKYSYLEPQILDGGAVIGFVDGHATAYSGKTQWSNNPSLLWNAK